MKIFHAPVSGAPRARSNPVETDCLISKAR